MKYVYLFCLALGFLGCGGSSQTDETLSGSTCQVAHCHCPTDYTPSCKDDTCLCLKTEVITIDSGPADTGPTGCQSPADCHCDPSLYETSCFEGICYCTELIPKISIDLTAVSSWSRVAIAGQKNLMSASYKVLGTSQQNPLKKLSVVNRPDGLESAIQSTLAIERVSISCAPPSGTGDDIVTEASLVNGVANFDGLSCYDQTGNGLTVMVNYDVADFPSVGDSLSGQRFRLVLDDSQVEGDQHEVQTRVVRKTRPEFHVLPGSLTLINGESTLCALQIGADYHGALGMARFVCEFIRHESDGGTPMEFNNFKLYRDGSIVSPVFIHDSLGHDLTSGQFLEGSSVIIAFQAEEVVSGGSSANYLLKAMTTGVDDGDTLVPFIPNGDIEQPVTGKTSETTPNTARLISPIYTVGLFTNILYFQTSVEAGRNIIWSDLSASNHAYGITEGSSSYDWTNGWGLEIVAVLPSAN